MGIACWCVTAGVLWIGAAAAFWWRHWWWAAVMIIAGWIVFVCGIPEK
jgi:hypothetical protein